LARSRSGHRPNQQPTRGSTLESILLARFRVLWRTGHNLHCHML
jgi:hypothetical protein